MNPLQIDALATIISADPAQCTAACRTLHSAEKLAGGRKQTRAISLDVTDAVALLAAVAAHDLVIR